MADPVVETPVAAPPAPVVAAPAPAPVAAAEPAVVSPLPAEPAQSSPAAVPPAASEAKPAEPPSSVEPAAAAPTLLEKFDKEKADAEAAKAPAAAAAAKPASPTEKPAEAPKPTDAPQQPVTAAAPPPVEYKYTLPETIKMDDALKGRVHKAFDDFRANPADGAQNLINLHEQQMRDFAQHMANEQQRIFAETRQNWAKQVLSDPEIGGSGHQTAMGAVARMRDLLVPERERPAFEEFLRVTGAGDHPQFLKLLHQAARYYDEPSMPPPNPRPPPTNGARRTSRLRDIYENTRSNAEGRS